MYTSIYIYILNFARARVAARTERTWTRRPVACTFKRSPRRIAGKTGVAVADEKAGACSCSNIVKVACIPLYICIYIYIWKYISPSPSDSAVSSFGLCSGIAIKVLGKAKGLSY